MSENVGVTIDNDILPIGNGPFSSKIRGGFSLSVAKSGLQKSIRRGDRHMAYLFALLWFEVGELYPPIMTNLINRLLIICVEDCATNISLFKWIDEKIMYIRKNRGKMDTTNLKSHICHVVDVLVESPKTRIASWAKAVYYTALRERSIELYEIYPELKKIKIESDKCPSELKSYICVSKSQYPLLSVYYAIEAHDAKNKKLLDSIWNYIECDNIVTIFKKWYLKETSERLIYLIIAHVYMYNKIFFDKKEITMSLPPEKVLHEFNNVLLNGKITIPPWAIDMHTYEGRKNGKGCSNFANEGSHIENIWDPLYNKQYVSIYNALKNNCKLKLIKMPSITSAGADAKEDMDESHEISRDTKEPSNPKKANIDKTRTQCMCVTSKGTQCKKYVVKGTLYCSIHKSCIKSEINEVKQPLKIQCLCKTKKGIQCKKYPTKGTLYCNIHKECTDVKKNVKESEEKYVKESERFSFIVRAQLVTSMSKQDTYFATDNLNENKVFVKGPFKILK
jgi:hypothetical protein